MPVQKEKSCKTLQELSDATGKPLSSLCRWRQRTDSPKSMIASAWIAWIRSEIVEKHAPSKVPSSDGRLRQNRMPHLNGNDHTSPVTESKDPLIVEMIGPNSSPITMLRAAMRMSAMRVANSFHKGVLSANELDGFKKTSQELRAAETSYIELEEKRASLIPRRDVELIVGEVVGRLVRCSDNLENSIATEFAVWLSDDKVRTMSQDDRSRLVRTFVEKANRRIRETESATIDDLLKAIRHDG